MSKLEELIQQYCPDGVEWKRIEELCKTKTPPCKLKTNEYQEYGVYPIIDQGQKPIAGYTDNEDALVDDGEYILYGDHTCIVKYHNGCFAQGADGLKILISSNNNTKYVYYAFCAYNLLSAEYKRHWTQAKEIEIPIPPLPVQEEIVRILDAFEELQAELQAELQKRKQQYNYYRDNLLSFEGRTDVQWKKLGDVAYYVKNRVNDSLITISNYVSVENLLQNRQGKTNASNVPDGSLIHYESGDILIGNIRPYLKKIWLADGDGGTNGDVLTIRANRELLTPEFLYQCLASDDFFQYDMNHAKGAKMPRGSKEEVLNYMIPITSLAEQQRIVSILDRFDTLTTDLTQGLPAEIEKRRQQYEFYRDKLLTFKRKEA